MTDADIGSREWDWAAYREALKRQRERRLSAPGRARVTHPRYGSVVVPCSSGFAAVMNAAELWGCDWAEIIDASVENLELTAPVTKE